MIQTEQANLQSEEQKHCNQVITLLIQNIGLHLDLSKSKLNNATDYTKVITKDLHRNLIMEIVLSVKQVDERSASSFISQEIL